MNRLKHIRGINVSRHIPSNVALPSRNGQHTDVYFENGQFRSQVSRSDGLSVATKNHDVGLKYSKQFRRGDLRLVSKGSKTICKQRSRTKSSVTSLKKKSSMDKKLPLESVVKTVCHYSTCQNVKFNSSGFNKQHKSQIVAIMNGARNTNHYGSFVASIEKYPRSYAEMIADYSEALYKASTVGVRNDSLYFDNTIRKSPFSTFSTPSSTKKIVNLTEYNGVPIEGQENYSSLPADAIESFGRCIQHDNINTVECHDFQHHDRRIAKTINKVTNQDCIIPNDLKNDDHSYAKLIADYSKSMHNISLSSISNGGLVLNKNVLARNSLQSFVTPRKANSTNTQETLRKTSLTVATIPLKKNVKEQLIVPKKHNWLKEIESVTNDLKSVIKKGTARAVNISNDKLKENDTPQFADTFDNSQNKVHRLTKLIEAHKQKEKDTIVKKLDCQFDKTERLEKRNKDFALQKHNYSQLSDKGSTTSPTKGSTHVSDGGISSVLKQPQVKLRMVPSEKESVVSINVDSVSTGLQDSLNPASKQLSVVVQSDRKEDLQSTENQWNVSTLRRDAKSAPQRNGFGPMRISISEDSAPIKQIEFSINGKPVSELKSITARTERLDVVSSIDKIEIRIPFAKDDANASSKIRETELSRETDSSTGQILNVQISANFQNESMSNVDKSRETMRKKNPLTDKKNIRSPTNKSENESSDPRVPSKMIPWWSSSDSFNKIKKKEEPKPHTLPLNQNEKKAISNLNHNLVTGSLPSKGKETSNSTTITNKIQSINDATINNSSNLASYSSSVEKYVESKPHYSHSFRLKPNKGNSSFIPDIMKNDLKTKYNQMATIQEDKKIFGIIQTKSIPLSTSGATNIGEHDVSTREKTSVLQKRVLNSAQDLLSKSNQKKKDNYFLKQTKSIDDVFSTKAKIEDISDSIKLIEKRKGTLINYNLKPTVKLNNQVKETQNPSAGTITTKNLMSNISATEIKEEISKTIPLKQNRSKNLSNTKNTLETIQEIEKLRNLTLSKLQNNQSKESSDKTMTDQKKSSLEIINKIETKYNINTNKIDNIDNQSQTKFNSKIITKAEDRTISKNLKAENANEMPDKFIKKMDKKDDTENKIARIVTQNLKSKDSLSKNCEKNLDKSKSDKKEDKRNPSASANFLSKKSNDSIVSKSANSKTKFVVMSNDNSTCDRKSMLMESLYPNFNRRDDTVLNSQSAIVPRNLHNHMLEHRASRVIRNAGPWINAERPEKSMLYSVWLQRSTNDINKNEKLF
ncbi:uncharacterized protein [Anoplolepis gracilipes]|uniref:uncharacterized protein n=1 Tax=Anoplolepis gracilipes TaxID=354296 RepID=UPI003B9EA2DD